MATPDAQSTIDNIADQIGEQLTAGQDNEPTPAEPQEAATQGQEASGQGDEPRIDPLEQQARDLGWLPHDEYEKTDKDPDNWMGFRAFMRNRDRIDSQRQMRQELKETKQGISSLVQRFDQMTKREQEKHRQEIEAALKKAKDDLDVNAIDDAHKQLREIDQAQAAQTQAPISPQDEHPVIQQYRTDNPMLDKAGSEFNEAFNTVMENKANTRLMNLTHGGQVQISDSALKQALDDAFRETKTLFPDSTPQPKPRRQAPATGNPGRKPATVDPLAKLDPEARDHYNFIKKKAGERAAKRFLELHEANS